MEIKGIELALTYLNAHPGEAAHLLEQQPMQETAAFLEGIPHDTCATVLTRMLPQHVSRLCEHMSPETCAAIFSKMEISQVAAVLRHANPTFQTTLRKLLPERVKLGCQVLLGYSQHSVGAWMMPNVSALPSDCTVEEALSRIREDDNFLDLANIHVVNRESVLLGILSCRKLLSSSGDTKISTIMHQNPRVVQGRSTVEAALQLTGWRSRDVMAVVNRKNQFVGIIRHSDLRKAVAQARPAARIKRSEGIFFQVFGIYGKCLIALINTVGIPPRRIKA